MVLNEGRCAPLAACAAAARASTRQQQGQECKAVEQLSRASAELRSVSVLLRALLHHMHTSQAAQQARPVPYARSEGRSTLQMHLHTSLLQAAEAGRQAKRAARRGTRRGGQCCAEAGAD